MKRHSRANSRSSNDCILLRSQVRILRKPPSVVGSEARQAETARAASAAARNTHTQSAADRDAAYAAARERILGAPPAAARENASFVLNETLTQPLIVRPPPGPRLPASEPEPNIVRQPRGPPPNNTSSGFVRNKPHSDMN